VEPGFTVLFERRVALLVADVGQGSWSSSETEVEAVIFIVYRPVHARFVRDAPRVVWVRLGVCRIGVDAVAANSPFVATALILVLP
jgi:hypothetical protein